MKNIHGGENKDHILKRFLHWKGLKLGRSKYLTGLDI